MNKVWFPSKRVIRTTVQAVVSLVAVLSTIVVVAPQVIEALTDVLPGSWVAWLSGVVAVVAAVSAALTRVMLIPQVNGWLTRFGLGTAPQGAVAVEMVSGAVVPMTRREYREYVRERAVTDFHRE